MYRGLTIRENDSSCMLERRGCEPYGHDSPPEALLLLCTDPILDSRLLPQLHSEPLLVWRSSGPTLPPYGRGHTAVETNVEHAVTEVGVREVIICGHLPSERLRAFVDDKPALDAPEDAFLYYAQATRQIVQKKYGRLALNELLQAIVEENVFVQMANLRTYPAVLAGLARGCLQVHGWIYDIDNDELYGHGPDQSLFLNRVNKRARSAGRPQPYLDPCDIYLA